jgi:hypothetical protein
MIPAAAAPSGQARAARDAGAIAEGELEHELKIGFPASRAAEVLVRLAALCLPDPLHPANSVVSTYYDTIDLTSLYEKIDSHRAKVKVRLRWYEGLDGSAGDDPSFLEVKYRFGNRRAKRRLELPLTAAELAATPLSDPRLADLPSRLWQIGVAPPPGLSPCVTVRYQRYRFTDPMASGALPATRLSLDTGILLAAGDPRRVAPHRYPPLPMAVLEVKNREGRLPRHLKPLLPPGWRLISLSKYAACFLAARGTRQLLLDTL